MDDKTDAARYRALVRAAYGAWDRPRIDECATFEVFLPSPRPSTFDVESFLSEAELASALDAIIAEEPAREAELANALDALIANGSS